MVIYVYTPVTSLIPLPAALKKGGCNMLLAEMKHPEVESYLEGKKTVIVPCGSTEQHGLHAPLGTDAITSFEIAKEAGKRAATVVAPVLSFGFSPGLHCTFPGTVSLRGTTLIAVVEDLLESLLRSGFFEIMFLSGHGMNMGPLNTAVGDFLNYNDAHIIVAGYWDLPEFKALLEDGEGVHATVSETAMVLYLYPELVDMSKAVHEQNSIPYYMGRSEVRSISKTGVIANPTLADAEKGKRYFEAAVEGVVNLLGQFSKK